MESIISKKTKDFAIKIVNFCDRFKHNQVLINQLLRSGTSIGANIQESQYAQSRADFISKLEIALKECNETEYWLEILYRTGKIEEESYKELIHDAGLIRKMLIKSCKTAKCNM